MTQVALAADFTKGPLEDLGVSVTRTPVTKTNDNVTGDKDTSEGTDVSITVVFKNPNQIFNWKEQGEEKGATTQCFVSATTTINKEDKILWQTLNFRVKAVSEKYSANTLIFKKIDLELI